MQSTLVDAFDIFKKICHWFKSIKSIKAIIG